MSDTPIVYLEDHPSQWMVDNHGDCKSPKDPVANSFQMAMKMAEQKSGGC